jgi:hypothetical protein
MAEYDNKRSDRDIRQARYEEENRGWVPREACMSLRRARELDRRHGDCEMLLHQAENLR